MVADLTDDLEVADDGPPFVFFGHCLGALLAFEVTRELRRRGRALPERLLVAGDTPARSTDVPPVDDVKAAMRASGAVSERILANAEVFALFEPAIRADLGLASRYRYAAEPPLTVPIDVFVASADVESHAVAGEWGAETTGDLRVIAVEGDSLYPHGAWAGLASAVFAAAGRTGAGRGGFR